MPGRNAGPIAWANDVQNNNFFTINVVDYSQNTITPVSYTCYAGDFTNGYEDRMYGCDNGSGETLLEIDVATGTGTAVALCLAH